MATEAKGNSQLIAIGESGRMKEDHPDIVEDGYIVQIRNSVNSRAIAEILSSWIHDAPQGSITHRSSEWILDQWDKGRGVMVLGYPQGRGHIDIFGDTELDEETLKEHIVSAAFLNQLDGIPLEEEVELGTVITNPHYQSNGTRRGVGGGIKAFQAAQDRAHTIFRNARLFSWVKNGSLSAIQNAFSSDVLKGYTIEDLVRAEAVFAGCAGCPGQEKPGMCCHQGFEIANEALHITFDQAS